MGKGKNKRHSDKKRKESLNIGGYSVEELRESPFQNEEEPRQAEDGEKETKKQECSKDKEMEVVKNKPFSKAERKIISDFRASLSDNEYQLKCLWAIQTIESKLSMIDVELKERKERVVISQVTHRIKSAESIYRKLERKGYKINLKEAKKKLNDIIGVRVTCLFQDDVYEIVKCLSLQGDIRIIKEKDYIKEPKETGYQSLHLIVEVPIYLTKKAEWVRVEIQIRTVAMDFWSVLDYQLLYKKEVKQADEISKELKHYAEIIADVDINMMKLRDRILAI